MSIMVTRKFVSQKYTFSFRHAAAWYLQFWRPSSECRHGSPLLEELELQGAYTAEHTQPSSGASSYSSSSSSFSIFFLLLVAVLVITSPSLKVTKEGTAFSPRSRASSGFEDASIRPNNTFSCLRASLR